MSDDDDSEPPRPRPLPVPVAGRYEGPSRAAPYPLSRMAPSFSLVDVAQAIQAADQTLATMTSGKLSLIADQIQRLQAEARGILEKAKRDAELHRVSCAFEKRPGGVYHLYRRATGELWFSRLAPEEWVTPQAQTFEGTYLLELDQSFTRVDTTE